MSNDKPKTEQAGAAGGPPPRSAPPPSPPPPRGPHWITILVAAGALALGVAAGVYWGRSHERALDRGERQHAVAASSQPAQTVQYYTCGMHPQVLLPEPGDCPICHMQLVPVDPSKFGKEIVIDPVIVQDIGIRVTPVITGAVTRVIRTIGTVEYNETAVRDITLKTSGWIEKLYVDYQGKAVEAGQPLLDLYSPDLFAAQEEYLQAYKSRQAASGPATRPVSAVEEVRWDTQLLESARKRLENFGISPAQIKELEQTGKAARTMAIRSPYRGLAVIKNAYEGMKAEAGMQLFRIADLSTVWVMVSLYENQLPMVELGQEANVSLSYIPNQAFAAKVTYIYPYLSKELRQVQVRLELENPRLLLKPGMYANVELHSTLAQNRVLAPREAVIDTGERKVAFVSMGQGRFETRNVMVGEEAQDGMIVIRDGLKSGELVVTSGEFLLDSDARLREARAKMITAGLVGLQKATAAVAGASELASLPPEAAAGIVKVLDDYLQIGRKLSSDTTEGLPAFGKALADGVDALIKIPIPQDEHFWHRHADEAATIRGKALELMGAKDIAAARETFADLGTATGKLLRATGVPPSYGKEVQELHCPMYRAGQGGTNWLQPAGPVRNPYYGQSMLECFDSRESLPVTGAKGPATQPASAE